MAGSGNRPPPDLPGSVLAVVSRYVRPGERVVAGLSGGLDSVVLLDCLRRAAPRLGFRLRALHVHHGLSPNADAWEAFCRALCGRWGLPLDTERVRVEPDSGGGIEAPAREARYAAFAGSGADWIALAHQRDDQAETLLFNLLRGCGVRGAAAMPVVRALDRGGASSRLLRPLLDVPRCDIEAHARAQRLEWIEDESNLDPRPSRNYLRREVLPVLRARFPGVDAALARAAGHFAEAQDLLDGIAERDRTEVADEGRILLARFARLDRGRATNLLRLVLREAGVRAPDARRFDDLTGQLRRWKPGGGLRFVIDGRCLQAWRGRLYIEPARAAAPAPIAWNGQRELAWAGGWLSFAPATGEGVGARALEGAAVEVRARAGGERLRPQAGRPSRSLKALAQAAGIPPWQRPRMPLVWVNDALAWVAGIGAAAEFACPAGEPGVRIDWLNP